MRTRTKEISLLVLQKKIVSNGAPCVWCAISNEDTNGAPVSGAPLLYSSGAPHTWCAINVHIGYSPFPSSGCHVNADYMTLHHCLGLEGGIGK